MKLLLFSQKLIYSGANIVAIDLAGQMKAQGHDVIVYGSEGPMVDKLSELGLQYRPMGVSQKLNGHWPSIRVSRELRKLVKDEGVDLVHTYEWSACLEALIGPYRSDGVPVVASVMSMRVERFMPRTIPVIVGTRGLRDGLVRSRYRSVTFIPPSIDVRNDSAGFGLSNFRKEIDMPDEAIMVAIVSRLAPMKMQSTLEAMEAIAELSKTKDVRLVIVGGGSSESEAKERAKTLNSALGSDVIFFTGPLGDPRPVYNAADVVIGMGSSALRGLAFSKPVIVVGDNGYAELFTPETSGEFIVQGLWGLGEGDGVKRIHSHLERLLDDVAQRETLGNFGRKFVCERFALEQQAEALSRVYEQALALPPQPSDRRSDVARTIALLMVERGKGFIRRRGRSYQSFLGHKKLDSSSLGL